MELAQLRALVTVVDEGGFTNAAQVLGLNQSTVSRAVAALEEQLGIPLLVRGSHGRHQPTAAGAEIVHQGRRVLDSVNGIEAIARTERADLTGHVRIATLPSAGPLIAADVARFTHAHPGVTASLLEGTDGEISGWLADGQIDLGTVAVNIPRPGPGTGAAPEADAGQVPPGAVIVDRWICALPRDHPLAGETVIELPDLADDDFLMSDGGCEPQVRELARAAGARIRVTQRIRDIGTLLVLVREGFGVTVVPELALDCAAGIATAAVATQFRRCVFIQAGSTRSRAAERLRTSLIHGDGQARAD
jgi:DNA-binding transcriptional LysR family regulator